MIIQLIKLTTDHSITYIVRMDEKTIHQGGDEEKANIEYCNAITKNCEDFKKEVLRSIEVQ